MSKFNIDPKKIKFDGRSVRLIIEDENKLIEKLKRKQAEIIKDIKEREACDSYEEYLKKKNNN